MLSIFYSKYNILLVDGNHFFRGAFKCFLESVYELSLHCTTQNGISIPNSKDVSVLLNSCLNSYLTGCINQNKQFAKQHKVLSNFVLYFSLKIIDESQEIFNFFDKKTIYKYINQFIKSLNRKKINFFIHKEKDSLNFNQNFEIATNASSKIIETLNIISFKLS